MAAVAVRRIDFEGLPNTRDLGGLPASGGLVVKPRRLLRSGTLTEGTPSDLRRLVDEFDLRTVVDFRTEVEASGSPDPAIPGVRHIYDPILEASAIGITRDEESDEAAAKTVATATQTPLPGTADRRKRRSSKKLNVIDGMYSRDFDATAYMEGFYVKAVTGKGPIARYRAFFDILLAQGDSGAVLWHCSMGKDRAGLGTAMVLMALGVPHEAIVEDFLATNEFLREVNETDADLHAQKVAPEERPDLRRRLLDLYTVKPSYLQAAFRAVCDLDGSPDAYMERELGLGPAERAHLLELYAE